MKNARYSFLPFLIIGIVTFLAGCKIPHYSYMYCGAQESLSVGVYLDIDNAHPDSVSEATLELLEIKDQTGETIASIVPIDRFEVYKNWGRWISLEDPGPQFEVYPQDAMISTLTTLSCVIHIIENNTQREFGIRTFPVVVSTGHIVYATPVPEDRAEIMERRVNDYHRCSHYQDMDSFDARD